jgi:hypothetical protein
VLQVSGHGWFIKGNKSFAASFVAQDERFVSSVCGFYFQLLSIFTALPKPFIVVPFHHNDKRITPPQA